MPQPHGPAVPVVAHESYANPPLRAMLGQVTYPAILRLGDTANMAPLQEALRELFSDFRQEQQVSLVIGPNQTPQATTATIGRFISSDGRWSALVTPETLTVEANVEGQYTSYDSFVEHFAAVWGVFTEIYRPARVIRQGLRYVDHLEGERTPAEWQGLVNPVLLGPLLADEYGTGLVHTLTETHFSRPEGLLVFKHGIVRAGPANTIGFVMDFDYVIHEPLDDLATEKVLGRFADAHKLLTNLFRWSITDAAREEFGVVNH